MAEVVRCVAIDDEPPALEIISKFCIRIGDVELHTFSDPEEGMSYIRAAKPDLVFMDIEMDDVSGLSLAAELPEDTCFIFTTAYLKYALDGYDLDAVDYLHKPFSFSRFQTAFAKAMRRMGRKSLRTEGQCIVVKQNYSNVSIPIDDILYLEALEGYTKIFRTTGECIITRMVLKNASAMLPPENFVRIHRSFIVSKSKVKSFNNQEVILLNGQALSVGRQYSAEICNLFSAN